MVCPLQFSSREHLSCFPCLCGAFSFQATALNEMLLEQVHESLKLATRYSLDELTEDGYWCAEVHSNTTFTAGMYILKSNFPRKRETMRIVEQVAVAENGIIAPFVIMESQPACCR